MVRATVRTTPLSNVRQPDAVDRSRAVHRCGACGGGTPHGHCTGDAKLTDAVHTLANCPKARSTSVISVQGGVSKGWPYKYPPTLLPGKARKRKRWPGKAGDGPPVRPHAKWRVHCGSRGGDRALSDARGTRAREDGGPTPGLSHSTVSCVIAITAVAELSALVLVTVEKGPCATSEHTTVGGTHL